MMSVAIRGLTGRKLRTVLTGIAIVLGTAMISGTFVLRDQINRAFDDIFTEANAGTDVVVTKKAAFNTDAQGGNGGPVPASLVTTVGDAEGVSTAVGQIQQTGSLVVDGDYIAAEGGAPNLVISWAPKPFDTNTFVAGHAPEETGQVVVNKQMADDNDLTLGEQAGLTTEFGVKPVTIVGIFTVGSKGSIGGATLTGATLADAQQWYDMQDEVSYILVDGDEGVSPTQLKQNVQQVVPGGIRVETGTENAQRSTDEVGGSINGFLTPLLLAFAGAAVFVGAFIIFNTFSITVAQRTREFAMLRTIGANRRQVMTSVMVEALAVGLLASITGIIVGIGFAILLTWVFDALGFGLPTADARPTTLSIVIPLAVGTLISLLAAFGPALRATRVPPIAALREGAELPHGRFYRFQPYFAGLLGLGGLALLIQGIFGDGGTSSTLLSMAAGAILVFIAVAMMSKYIIRPLARLIGWPAERLGRATGRLARENTMRNPARTAITSSALMIGVGLVVFVAVFVNGFKDSFLGALDRSVTGDLIIQSDNFSTPIPKESAAAASAVPGVDAVSGMQFGEAKIGNGGTDFVTGIDPTTIDSVYKFDWVEGDSDSLNRLTGNTTVVEEQFAKSHNLSVGDTVKITSPDDVTLNLKVLGIYDDPVLMTGLTIPSTTYDNFSSLNDFGVVLVNYAPDADPAATKAGVEKAFEQFPMATVRTNAEYKANTEDQVNGFLSLLYVLLAMCVIIALFGIVNTLALSVFERTREIGMLRAIGMTRRQLRRVVRWESVITAIIGGLLGIGIGLVFGWMVTKGLEDQGIEFAVPYGQLLIFLIVSAIAGVLAAILPARRAAKLDVLQALQYE
jgi:putative ABC transport system permease protein